MKKAVIATKSNTIERPPVVVIMGHIDHGKSTLLDFIRKSNIVDSEAGGITQHLGAYEVEHKTSEGKKCKITFLDTPGHEAFCGIRERGTQAADIAILLVSAEDGVKPQTVEALKCIREEKIPFIVAINKIDKPNANIERTKISLAEHEIYVEGYGGDVPVVEISALNGKRVPELLDMINLVAEMENLVGDTGKAGEGVIIEAKMDSKKGIGATVLVKDGTISVGKYIISQDSFSPIRMMEDSSGKPIQEATFSSPIKIIGWNKIPTVGSSFKILDSKKEAEEMISEYKDNPSSISNNRNSNSKIVHTQDNPEIIYIPIMIKADVIGSLEGIRHELAKINHEKVSLKIISEGIGEINEGDVKMAIGSPDIILISFNSKPDAKAKAILERNPINIHSFSIIYDLIEFIKNTLASKVPKVKVEEILGKAKIMATFSRTKDKQIVGGKVQEGEIKLGSEVKILRRDVEIGRGKIRELQQQKQKASEVREGYEFGTMIESKIEIAQGDKIEAFQIVEK